MGVDESHKITIFGRFFYGLLIFPIWKTLCINLYSYAVEITRICLKIEDFKI